MPSLSVDAEVLPGALNTHATASSGFCSPRAGESIRMPVLHEALHSSVSVREHMHLPSGAAFHSSGVEEPIYMPPTTALHLLGGRDPVHFSGSPTAAQFAPGTSEPMVTPPTPWSAVLVPGHLRFLPATVTRSPAGAASERGAVDPLLVTQRLAVATLSLAVLMLVVVVFVVVILKVSHAL